MLSPAFPTTGYVRSAWLHAFSCVDGGAGGQRAAFVHPIKNLREHRFIFPCFGVKNIARLVHKTGFTAKLSWSFQKNELLGKISCCRSHATRRSGVSVFESPMTCCILHWLDITPFQWNYGMSRTWSWSLVLWKPNQKLWTMMSDVKP